MNKTAAQIREWAKQRGYPVADTGRVSDQIVAEYEREERARILANARRAPLKVGLDG